MASKISLDVNHASAKPPPKPSPLRKAKFFKTGKTENLGYWWSWIHWSHLVDKLKENKNNEVIVVDNYFTGTKDNLKQWIGHPRFELIQHDVTKPLLIEVDQIYHLACSASPTFYKHNPVKDPRELEHGMSAH